MFPRPDSEKFKKNQEKKTSKRYNVELGSNSTTKVIDIETEVLLNKLKELME